ncbi:hypothetical protein SU69_07725 [Thermosipho melanesiensis]|uniref:Uncharacterized protein n=2 Tax=Thermosipho melanesiensis TaxID=46541 RepID=A6LN65_THEM4|nr:hypothetical protein [Thermosipho melanesiensis]ABR31366.1 hypothetical protein Tmel_1521 [Thermosipho melanesiensis BI429]APT74426.1 hypothetical protein BW47_08080 [Thermosipho melanesiensis]OOC36388.1 hypothetical protein SU68_07795 [Thermosipho melanesiensis]OOC37206.1 hypothetical protein SU69_07725 [Thermosipho melanesiensis]OOC37958.1 hypothetical protein SU70_07735 [Thermosipho melanesiensis]
MRKYIIVISVIVFSIFVFSNVPISIGTIERNNEKYFVYELSPEFSLGPVTVGIGFTVYATDVVYGQLYYGVPSSTPSTNIINAFVLNTLGFKANGFEFRYGKTVPVTLALGFNMRRYINENTRAFDVKFKPGNFEIYAHLPYELTKFVPFEFVQSDSIYFGSLMYDTSFLDFQIYGITDTAATKTYLFNSTSTPVKYAGGVATYIPFGFLKLGFEYALQSDEKFSSLGNGIFAGVYGNIGILEPIGGIYYMQNGYIPFLFGKNYNEKKYTNSLEGLKDIKDKAGYFVGVTIDLEPYGNGEFYVYGSLDGATPTAEGNVRIVLPEVGNFSGLYIDGFYYDSTPFQSGEFFDEDTDAYLKISYPIIGENFVAGVIYKWEKNDWVKSLFVGGLTSF